MAKKILCLVAFAVIGTIFMTASASANTVVAGQPTIVSSSSSSDVVSVETADVDVSTQGKMLLRWVSTKPKKTRGCKRVKSFQDQKIRKHQLTCVILPVGTPFNNSGVNSQGQVFTFGDHVKKGDQKFFRKNSRTNKWCKATCRNCAEQTRPSKLKAENVILVKSFTKVKFKVTIDIRASAIAAANATCVAQGVWASASASAQGAASTYVYMYVYAWTKEEARANAGVSIKQKQDVEAEAQAQAVAKTTASASASCTGTTFVCPVGSAWNGERCAKDGTTTPPPPADAPGPNPPPSSDDPAPGGHQCYSETTGLPVNPRSDGTCPAGSYGA